MGTIRVFQGRLTYKMLWMQVTPEHPNVSRKSSSPGSRAVLPPSWQSLLHCEQPSTVPRRWGRPVHAFWSLRWTCWDGRAGVGEESWPWPTRGDPAKETGGWLAEDFSQRPSRPSFWGSLNPPPLHSHLAIINNSSALRLLWIAEALRKYKDFCKMIKFA